MKTRTRTRDIRINQRLVSPIQSRAKTSAQRVREFRERQKKKEGYDHEKVKEETRKRVAAIRAKLEKCPLGRKCKDQSCKLKSDSKRKTMRRMASTPGYTPVKKRLRESNIRVREERLFKDDEEPLPGFGEKVIKFMLDNQNSFECPDKKNDGICFRRDTLEILHERFMMETLIECSLRSFTRYIPPSIKKPKPEDWGTSLCKTCLNPELKVEALKLPDITLNKLLDFDNDQLKSFEETFSITELVTYKEWISEPVTHKKTSESKPVLHKENITINTKSYRSVKAVKTANSKVFVKKLIAEIKELQKHNERKISQFRRIKEIKKKLLKIMKTRLL